MFRHRLFLREIYNLRKIYAPRKAENGKCRLKSKYSGTPPAYFIFARGLIKLRLHFVKLNSLYGKIHSQVQLIHFYFAKKCTQSLEPVFLGIIGISSLNIISDFHLYDWILNYVKNDGVDLFEQCSSYLQIVKYFDYFCWIG